MSQMLQDKCYWTQATGHTLQNTIDRTHATEKEYTLKWFIDERGVGHMLNSSREDHAKSKQGNVTIHRNEIFVDKNGNMKVPMVAAWDIEEGEELEWDYDYLAGIIG